MVGGQKKKEAQRERQRWGKTEGKSTRITGKKELLKIENIEKERSWIR